MKDREYVIPTGEELIKIKEALESALKRRIADFKLHFESIKYASEQNSCSHVFYKTEIEPLSMMYNSNPEDMTKEEYVEYKKSFTIYYTCEKCNFIYVSQ